ncbi:MAG: BatD family protein [Myxococcaceae bacterium]|nr:BatD family protein [Myxococcaceae bacterium]
MSRRTGSAGALPAAAVLMAALLAASPARAAEPELSLRADRTEVGTEDVFRVTVVVSGAPEGAELELPESPDFETLGSSQGTTRSISIMGGGAPVITTTRTVTLRMRANRPGTLTLPPAKLVTKNRTWRTEPLTLTVKRGSVGPDPRARARAMQDPFRNFPFPPTGGMPDLPDEEARDFPGVDVPRSDSDLFMRTTVDAEEVFVGQQVTMSVWVFSRVDLSSVDAVTMPQLEGFWTEEVDAPTQLSGEPRTVNGIPYRAFLLRRRALFPVKPGTLTVGEAEADITTGFLFAGRRVHRKTRPITLKVRPLPAGAPPGVTHAHVGSWALSAEASQTVVELGQPVTVKVALEGQGNVRNVPLPRLEVPDAFKVYEPSTTDTVTTPRNRVGGRRVMEYPLMPQRTGTFTLPALSFGYFDPETRRYEVTSTQPVTLTIMPGAGGQTSLAGAPGGAAGASSPGQAPAAHNVLGSGGVRPVRVTATFTTPSAPLHTRGFFWPLVLTPVGLWMGLSLVGLLRGKLREETEHTVRRRRTHAARRRLAEAEKLKAGGSGAAFFAEVERALLGFLEAQLHEPVQGLTREALTSRLMEAGMPQAQRARVLAVLEACEVGRFAPGGGEASRGRVLAEAAAAMEAWGRG